MNAILKYFKRNPITSILIGICVIVYIVSFGLYGIEMTALQGLEFGGFNSLYVFYYHEYYRFITSQFIHFGLMHLIMNCYSLFGISSFLESFFSKKRYIVIVFCSLISTSLLPYILFLINGFEANVVSGGISGLVFGLIGSLGALAIVYKNVFLSVFKQLSKNLIVMLFISFIVPSISLSGHVSGLIGGFVSTYIILLLNNKKKKAQPNLLN